MNPQQPQTAQSQPQTAQSQPQTQSQPWPFPPFPNLKDTGNRIVKFNPNNHEDAPL
jgi:hypothetical protein